MPSRVFFCGAPWTEGSEILVSCCPRARLLFELQRPVAPRLECSEITDLSWTLGAIQEVI